MSQIEDIHNQAMDLAEEAFIAKRKGDADNATLLFLQALEIEARVASGFPMEEESEPTRSILYRSAASMAYHAGKYERAEQLVANGLAGFPPIEIKQELRALQDDITFRYHISLRGAELAKSQMQMTLWGTATGYGIIAVELLIKRVDQIKTIFYRTVERLSETPYRTTGKPAKQLLDSYRLFLDGFSAGSFGVLFSIGEPVEQLPLMPEHVPEKIAPEKIIDEVITCFELLQENELDVLRDQFGNDDYYQNFVGIARQMAPDGDSIKVLGLASTLNGRERVVGLTRRRKEIPMPADLLPEVKSETKKRDPVRLYGVLKLADNLKTKGKTGTVKLRDEIERKTYTIRVPVTQMQDIVQPFFEEFVVISCYKEGRSYYLKDIDFAERTEFRQRDTDTDEPAPPTLF